MGSRIENLGDYNKMRLDLQAMGGNLADLYKEIGETAVAKAAPKLMFEGGVIAVGGLAIFGSMIFAGYKGIHFIKDRKLKINNESALKKKFAETMKDELDNDESNNEKLNEIKN